MGYEPTPVLRSPAIVRGFVPAIPQSLWTRSAITWVRTLPPEVPVMLLSHHMTPLLPGSAWYDFSHLFFGTMAKKYINVVFDDRDKQQVAKPKMTAGAEAGQDAIWFEETSKSPILKFWTADVPNILVTRPQGAPLSPSERQKMTKYDAVVVESEFADLVEKAMPEMTGKIHSSLGLVIGELLFNMT